MFESVFSYARLSGVFGLMCKNYIAYGFPYFLKINLYVYIFLEGGGDFCLPTKPLTASHKSNDTFYA